MDYNSREYDKMCSTFSDYNEYVVTGWMVNRLELKGNELVVFALIHAYSQAYGWYMNSQQYTADATAVSKVSVNNSLKKLVEKELLIKEDYTIAGTNSKFCKYKVNINKVNELCRPGKETLPPGEETCYNNIYNINNKDNNINIIKEKNFTGGEDLVEELFNSYTENDNLYNMLMEFRDFRNQKKKPLTEQAAKMLLNKLNKCKSDKEKIECLETSILNGWQSIYPKEEKTNKKAVYEIDDTNYEINTKSRRRKQD